MRIHCYWIFLCVQWKSLSLQLSSMCFGLKDFGCRVRWWVHSLMLFNHFPFPGDVNSRLVDLTEACEKCFITFGKKIILSLLSEGSFDLQESCPCVEDSLSDCLPYLLQGSWPRNSAYSCTEAIHPKGNSSCSWLRRSTQSQSQHRLDQDTKTLLAEFEGRDGQAPMQEFL